jgi:hypothetical protein
MIPQHDKDDKVCSDWDVEQRITNSGHANQLEFDTDYVHPKLKQNKTKRSWGYREHIKRFHLSPFNRTTRISRLD